MFALAPGITIAPTKETVLDALRHVMDPDLERNLIDLGMVRDVIVGGCVVYLTLAVTTAACPLKDRMVGAATAAVAAVPGVEEVHVETVEMTEQEKFALIRHAISVAFERAGAG